MGKGYTLKDGKDLMTELKSMRGMMAEMNGFIHKIDIDSDYESHIIDKMQWLFPGDKIDNYMTYKAGIVFFEYSTPVELREHMKVLYDHMKIDILV